MAAEIRLLISEIERFLGIDHLLTAQETDLLRQLIAKNPRMRLYREEAAQFLLRLVGMTDMDDFLQSRSKLLTRDLARLVDAYPLDQSADRAINIDGYRDLFRDTTRTLVRNRSAGTPSVLPMKSEQEEYAQKFQGPVEDSTWFQRVKNTTISFIPKSLREQPPSRNDNKNAIDSNYHQKPSESLSYIKMENQRDFLDRYGRSDTSDVYLQEQIRKLELQCERYEAELKQTRNTPTIRRLEELKRAIEDQDVIIERLERRNRLKYTTAEGLLPFLARLLGKSDTRLFNPSNIVFTLFVTFVFAILSLNVLKLIYFLIIMSFQNRKPIPYEEPYDDVVISFSWVQEIPWLEYAVYQFQEWAGY